MSYKAFANIKEHMELEAIKALTPEQINEALNNQHAEIENLKKIVNEFVTEHCDRAGDEYWPVAADRQGCPIVEKAMKLLDL